jgi:hypothetical protein
MLKHIFRTFIILIATGLAYGAIYLIVTNSSLGSFNGSSGQFEGNRIRTGQIPSGSSSNNTAPSFGNNEFQPGNRPSGGLDGGREGFREGGGNAAGILMNLLKVSVITMVIIIIGLISGKISRRKNQGTSGA